MCKFIFWLFVCSSMLCLKYCIWVCLYACIIMFDCFTVIICLCLCLCVCVLMGLYMCLRFCVHGCVCVCMIVWLSLYMCKGLFFVVVVSVNVMACEWAFVYLCVYFLCLYLSVFLFGCMFDIDVLWLFFYVYSFYFVFPTLKRLKTYQNIIFNR